MQDLVLDHSGDWFLTLRTDHNIGSPNWELIVRNLQSGEARSLAHGDPAVATIPNLPARLPYGLGPFASISGDRVVWSEFYLVVAGEAGRRLLLYDFTTGETSSLASTIDPQNEQIWTPSIAVETVAWAHQTTRNSQQEIVLYDLSTRSSRTIPVEGDIYTLALSPDGRFLVWDDSLEAKYALDLKTGEKLRYAGDEGWGTLRSGKYVSWIASSFPGGAAGFYDLEDHVARFVPRRTDILNNIGQVMGDWFVWQERDLTKLDFSNSYYYFMPLSRN